MNLDNLIEAANSLPKDAPLVFSTPDGPIGEGYHVTELKLARINSIDCAAQMDAWMETTLQLLDGKGKTHMPVGKFVKILEQSVQRVDGLGDSPLRVEFAHGNAGLQIFEPAAPTYIDGTVQLNMRPVNALCKPAANSTSRHEIRSLNEAGSDERPAQEGVDACCVKDADANAPSKAGCGCSGRLASSRKSKSSALSDSCCS